MESFKEAKTEFVNEILREGKGKVIYVGEVSEDEYLNPLSGLKGDEIDISYHKFLVKTELGEVPCVFRYRVRSTKEI